MQAFFSNKFQCHLHLNSVAFETKLPEKGKLRGDKLQTKVGKLIRETTYLMVDGA